MNVISSGIEVLSGVTSTGFEVVQEGVLRILNGGRANDVAASSGGAVVVSKGGILYVCGIGSGGTVTVLNSGWGESVSVGNGGLCQLSSGASAHKVYVSGGGSVRIGSDVLVTGATVLAGGTVQVDPTGYVRAPVVSDGGAIHVSSAGIADKTLLYGSAFVGSGGSFNSATVNPGGQLYVSAGGVAKKTVENGGYVSFESGANVGFVSNTFSGVELDGASATVHSGTTAVGTILNGGILEIFAGGSAVDTTVGNGGRLEVKSGGVLTGSVTVETGADVSAGEGAELDFDLRRASAGAGALVNDLSVIQGTPVYTLTVNGFLKPGKYDYSLADGAGGFDGAITVRDAAGETLGSLVPGEKTVLGGVEYVLILAASNLSVTVCVPDGVPPTVNDIRVTPDTPTNQDVLVTAVFSDDDGTARGLYRMEDEAEWSDYLDGVVVTRNTTVYLKAVDAFGLESEVAEVAVTNIDKDPPVITLAADLITPARRTTLTASTESGIDIYYSRDGGTLTLYTGAIEVTENGAYEFTATDAVGNTGTAGIVFENIYLVPQNLVGTTDRVSWDLVGAKRFILEFSTDGFEHGIRAATAGSAVDMFELPAGTWQWRVRADDSGEWATGEDIVSGHEPGAAEVVRSDPDGAGDIFFATPDGVWSDLYAAMHAGSRNDWDGTGEIVSAAGRGRIHDLYFGSDDLNMLCLTDGENGDAIFVDDIYTSLPESVIEHMARLYRIQEIRAGAGNDIVDMTSQQFEYIGDGLTIRGGDGDDIIWANKGSNMLFGDAGNDRIVGASGNDVIAGGIGNDRLHGGGGNDVFTFCDNWGKDTVEQLADGTVTLWFKSGDESHWNAETLTYTDGDNSVTVKGVTSVELKFGDDGSDKYDKLSSCGAFAESTSQKIFEEPGKGILASL